jgi:predicted aconitase with swiveling domain
MRLTTRPLVDGSAAGRLVVLDAPLSLWGGLDVESGTIADVTHPQHGLQLGGAILAMFIARGSSSSSSTLVEAARRGTAPAAIIMTQPGPILTIGSLVAADLYGLEIPILLIDTDRWSTLVAANGKSVAIETGGAIRL